MKVDPVAWLRIIEPSLGIERDRLAGLSPSDRVLEMPAVIDLVKKIYEVIRKYLDEATYDAFVGELSKLLEATPPEQDVEMVCRVEKAPEWEIGRNTT